MSHGAVLAFLITGSGTSMDAIAGARTIAKSRPIAFVYIHDLLSPLGIL